MLQNDIIKKDSLTHNEILANIRAFVQGLPHYENIKDNLDSSTIEVIYQLLASVSAWQFYYFNMVRQESYLSTATQTDSISYLSRMYGYNRGRAMCPKITLQYNDVPTLNITTGTKFGTYLNYEVFYFGEPRLIEKGDLIDVCIAHYIEKSGRVVSKDNAFSILLKAETLQYIDNTHLQFSLQDVSYNISKDIEAFVVNNEIVDFTQDENSTLIYIKDDRYHYGLIVEDFTRYKIKYVETDGLISTFNQKQLKLDNDKIWLYNSIATLGANTELLEKVKYLAPLFFSTMRRAVTEKDHSIIAKAHPLIKDANCYTLQGTAGKWSISLQNRLILPKDQFKISIALNTFYIVEATEFDDYKSIIQKLCQRITLGGWATAIVSDIDDTLIITNNNSRVDLSISTNDKFKEPVELVEQDPAPCCSLALSYIHINQAPDEAPLPLTTNEQLEYGKHLQLYKMSGVSIIMAPATQYPVSLEFEISLHTTELINNNSNKIQEYIREYVLNAFKLQYELMIGVIFTPYEFLAKIAQYELTIDDVYYGTPVKSIVYAGTQNTAPVSLQKDTYFVLKDLTINFK